MSAGGFRHEAVFYSGDDGFVREIAPFVADAVDTGEPVLVVVGAERIAALRDELGSDAARVQFADMAEVGSNPARIIPAWKRFVDQQREDAGPLRGVGEPIWSTRSPDELAECHVHESLLNVAFGAADRLWLRCPYDLASLDAPTIDTARRNHPIVRAQGVSRPRGASPADRDWGSLAGPALPAPEGPVESLRFDAASLATVRRFALQHSAELHLEGDRAELLALSAHEAASNSVRHGGGDGTVRIWPDHGDVVCEIHDSGSITQPLVGRVRPDVDHEGGRGLWIVNQLCDLSQVRSSPAGTTVRMRMRGPVAVPVS